MKQGKCYCSPSVILSCIVWLVAALLLPGLARAQSKPVTVIRKDYDMRRLAMPPALSETELKGRRLFVQRCALCHDPVGQPTARLPGPWLDAETLTSRGESAVRDKILKGSRTMPGFQYTLEPAEVDLLMTYMKTVTPDQKPKSDPQRRAEDAEQRP